MIRKPYFSFCIINKDITTLTGVPVCLLVAMFVVFAVKKHKKARIKRDTGCYIRWLEND
ncbi:exported hypothetical protein [Photobacterium kishitanii]|nr:exported hypothetical protein [Photobacterium kishitanii]